jgi:hypothetical protein
VTMTFLSRKRIGLVRPTRESVPTYAVVLSAVLTTYGLAEAADVEAERVPIRTGSAHTERRTAVALATRRVRLAVSSRKAIPSADEARGAGGFVVWANISNGHRAGGNGLRVEEKIRGGLCAV